MAQVNRRAYLMRYAQAQAAQLGLTDDERRELAMMLPSRSGAHEPVSWGRLDDQELATLVLWLTGAVRVYELLRLRPM